MINEKFDIPVVLFLFRRLKAIEVIRQIAIVKPTKIYLIGDGGRNPNEHEEVLKCRELVEKEITWKCEVIKNYVDTNRGVYQNIGLGARWVFEREEKAIFLEDDNLPEISFFSYCKELLEKYKEDTRVLWICGTNYLEKYKPERDVSYVFTRHMLPCGWASWSNKFLKFYDGELKYADDKKYIRQMRDGYYNNAIYKQYKVLWLRERKKIKSGSKPISWDFQMDFAIKLHGLYGIAPIYNQIKNIGVDECATHGGNTLAIKQIKNMCGMDSIEMKLPLKHPNLIYIEEEFEKNIYKILRFPLTTRIKQFFIIRTFLTLTRKIFKIPSNIKTKEYFFRGKR